MLSPYCPSRRRPAIVDQDGGYPLILRFWLHPLTNRRVPHISLVFREMWDTAGLALKPAAVATTPHGCPMFAPAYVG